MEWHKPFDFPAGMSNFPKLMVNYTGVPLWAVSFFHALNSKKKLKVEH